MFIYRRRINVFGLSAVTWCVPCACRRRAGGGHESQRFVLLFSFCSLFQRWFCWCLDVDPATSTAAFQLVDAKSCISTTSRWLEALLIMF